jgi:hypothetical protein
VLGFSVMVRGVTNRCCTETTTVSQEAGAKHTDCGLHSSESVKWLMSGYRQQEKNTYDSIKV